MNKPSTKNKKTRYLLIGGVISVITIICISIWAISFMTKTASSSLDQSLKQYGAVQECRVSGIGPGGSVPSVTDIDYEVNKNESDTVMLIKKAAADNGYGDLTQVTGSVTSSATSYNGSNKATGASVGFILYTDRKFTNGCNPGPSTGPDQTAFGMSVTNGH
jgi:hypothetical protein